MSVAGQGAEQPRGVAPLLRRLGKLALPVLLLVPVVPLLGIALAAGGSAADEDASAVGLGRLDLAQGVAPGQARAQGQLAAGALPVAFLRLAPDITAGATPPHAPRGRCSACHDIISAQPVAAPLPSYGPGAAGCRTVATTPAPAPAQALPANSGAAGAGGAAPRLAMLPFQEAHWQGLELIALTRRLGAVLRIPPQTRGVVVDEATMPADVQGFKAGDTVTAVAGVATPTLETFVAAADQVRGQRQVELAIVRDGQPQRLSLAALGARLGSANGETAPMITSGARSPHGALGPCTNCHRIGSGTNLAADLGDQLAKTAPPIKAGQIRPHGDRGTCSTCHAIQ